MSTHQLCAAILFVSATLSAQEHSKHTFQKTQLTDKFWAEGATFGDFNHDGKVDIVAGPYWYEGPDFKQAHEYYPATHTFTRKGTDGIEQKVEGFEGALGVQNT